LSRNARERELSGRRDLTSRTMPCLNVMQVSHATEGTSSAQCRISHCPDDALIADVIAVLT